MNKVCLTLGGSRVALLSFALLGGVTAENFPTPRRGSGEAGANQVGWKLEDHERRIGHLEQVSDGPRVAVKTDHRVKKLPARAIAGTPQSYRIEPGDTLYRIARRFGVSVENLQKLNRLSSTSLLQTGRLLRLPTATSSPSSRATAPVLPRGKTAKQGQPIPTMARRHTVKSGETLLSIGRRYGVSTQELVALNKLRDRSRLRAGALIRVPASAVEQRLVASKKAPASEIKGGRLPLSPKTAVVEEDELLPAGWKWHTVRQGESLSRVAAQHGIERRAVQRANSLSDSATLMAGKKLKIPPRQDPTNLARAKPAQRESATPGDDRDVLGYFVLKDDSVESLAEDFDTTPETLRQLNQMGRNEVLVPGKRIVVPNKGLFD
ncbi:MAG: LysM peptidoglycan-binding domain-containing protein [Verrucomicrobiales bacterium]